MVKMMKQFVELNSLFSSSCFWKNFMVCIINCMSKASKHLHYSQFIFAVCIKRSRVEDDCIWNSDIKLSSCKANFHIYVNKLIHIFSKRPVTEKDMAHYRNDLNFQFTFYEKILLNMQKYEKVTILTRAIFAVWIISRPQITMNYGWYDFVAFTEIRWNFALKQWPGSE